jgi:hypothetical protein
LAKHHPGRGAQLSDPSGAIIVVKFLCKNSDFITMLRVGTRDSTDTLRARIKKKLDDVHNYDIYLPSLARMAENTCLEDHHVKERVRFAALPFRFTSLTRLFLG